MDYKIVNTIIFLPMILYIGIITSYEDYLFSKIRNKWIILGITYALIVYGILFLFKYSVISDLLDNNLIIITDKLINNFDKWCINLTLSFLVAYILWYFEIWGAGDAKLFICFVTLIPIMQYSKAYLNHYFSSFVILLNVFITTTIFVFFRSLLDFVHRFHLNLSKQSVLGLIKEKFYNLNFSEFNKVLLSFFTIFLLFRTMRYDLFCLIKKIFPQQKIFLLLILFVFKPLKKILKNKSKFIIVIFIISIAYFIIRMVFLKQRFISEIGHLFAVSFCMSVLFSIFDKTIRLYIENSKKKNMPFAIWIFVGTLITWFF